MPDHDPLPPEIVAEYLQQLVTRRGEVEAHLAALPGAGEGPLRTVAHKLRGTGAIFGHDQLSVLAGEVEDAPAADLAETGSRLLAELIAITAPEGERILLVDDDPVMHTLLEATLRAPGRVIRTATNGAAADALLARERYDLVLLDLFLSDEDGRRLLRSWRSRPATSLLPVFILSARLGGDVKAECYALGADGYFEKPFDPAVIAAAVQGRLRRASGPVPAVRDPVAPRPAAPAGPAKVMIAEDDPLIARIVTHRLGKGGHQLTHVADGAAALAAIAQARPDLLILDIKMPEIDGLEVLRRLRADAATRTLPVILLTALGEEEDVVRGFGLGADDYLVKPFSPTELAVRVDRLLRR